MRTHGTDDYIRFQLEGWCIYNIAYKYSIVQLDEKGEAVPDSRKVVYVNDMKHLREELQNYRESHYGT